MKKGYKLLALICACFAVIVLIRLAMVYTPSDGKVIFRDSVSGINIDEPLSQGETVAVKKILWGKIRWPESFYGVPACGFGRNMAIIIEDTRYMLAWDSCGTLCVESLSSAGETFSYMDISDKERAVIEEIFATHSAN